VTEHWLLFAGALELGPDDAQVRVAAGGSTSFAGDVPHRYRADEGEDVAATLVVRYPAERPA
jgi:quercetin dioxygenase-like cupin family protein